MSLDHAWLLAHMPHQGSMCLLDHTDTGMPSGFAARPAATVHWTTRCVRTVGWARPAASNTPPRRWRPMARCWRLPSAAARRLSRQRAQGRIAGCAAGRHRRRSERRGRATVRRRQHHSVWLQRVRGRAPAVERSRHRGAGCGQTGEHHHETRPGHRRQRRHRLGDLPPPRRRRLLCVCPRQPESGQGADAGRRDPQAVAAARRSPSMSPMPKPAASHWRRWLPRRRSRCW